MKEHYLSVTTLEEYEPNREFVGRNFNAGEIIQLVLKARSGHWLPFNYVQMVMMHELAHCVQMNHSRAFWKVRNLYAEQMRVLWSRGYTGEGMWGRGALLATGEFERNKVAAGEELPEHLCGGTYRSRRRKRRAKPELSYQEKKQRRIEKKFGKNGVALGADTDAKAKLEKGRTTQAAPRVAQSKRGRELRAAAALARFEQQKQETTREGGPEDEPESADSETESDYEDAEGGTDDAIDLDGKKFLDAKGHHMVRVCGDEDADDHDAANELKELQTSLTKYFAPAKGNESRRLDTLPGQSTMEAEGSRSTTSSGPDKPGRETEDTDEGVQAPSSINTDSCPSKGKPLPGETQSGDSNGTNEIPFPVGPACPICSFQNEAYSVTCGMCSHVLAPSSVSGTWSCRGSSCQGSSYLNAGDRGTCGVCGQRKGEEG